MRKQRRVRTGIRWINFSGLGGDVNDDDGEDVGENDSRRGLESFRSASSSSMITRRFGSSACELSSPPWMWSLELGEPKDCLCMLWEIQREREVG